MVREDRARLPGHLEIFPCLDHEGADRGQGRRDVGVRRRRGVECRVDGDPEEPETARRRGPYLARALAHPAREHEGVESTERGGHPGDEGAEPMDVDVPREDLLRVACACAGEHLAHVRRAGERQEPRAMLERVRHLLHPDASVLEQPQQQTRVDGARTCRHDEAFHRCEPHRRVDRATALDGRDRGAGPEVAAHHPQPFRGPAEEGGRSARGVGVREPVEAEAAQRVPVEPLAWQGVGRRGGRHVAVEGRVEARHRRNVRKHGGHGAHHVEGGRLVQRCERCELAQGLEDNGIEAHRSGELRAAMHHTVRDRIGAAQPVERRAELLGIGSPRRGGQLGVPEERVVVAD